MQRSQVRVLYAHWLVLVRRLDLGVWLITGSLSGGNYALVKVGWDGARVLFADGAAMVWTDY